MSNSPTSNTFPPLQQQQSQQDNASPLMPAHSAAKRTKRTQVQETPDDFDERAKQNASQVTKIHEFRRENIRELEAPKKDYFNYDPEEQKRYNALKMETLFKFQTTYKAIKWGVVVGGMFAFHRYFRTRDFNAAAHWFTVMSFVSFFNIWISYGLQEFVTEYGSRKSLSLAARNEYHTNAYQSYLDNMQVTVRPMDDKIQPVLHNSQVMALNDFIRNYDEYLKDRFGTTELSKDEMIANIVIAAKENPDNLTTNQLAQIQMIKKDIYQNEIASQIRNGKALKEYVENALEQIDQIDLKSYDFSRDPDRSYKSVL
eukprot:403356067